MAKKNKQSAGRKRGSTAREARQLRRESARETEQKRNYNLTDCMKLGRIANILFVVFIIVCLIYYYSIAKDGRYFIPFEILAYSIETTAFVLFTLGVVWIDRLVRARRIMKVLLIIYIVVEVTLMLLEFQLLPWTYYNGLSLTSTIVHVIFSAGVSFSLLMLDPQNKKLQVIVTVTTVIILAGMFLGLAGYRVYASVLLNAFAYIFFFTAMLRQLALEEVEVDCYGDQAKVTSFDSTFFADAPTMIEKPERQKLSVRQKLRRAADQLTSEEKIVLTDKDEKFEYEFGVDDDDDAYDDEYDDDDADEEDT